MTETRCLYLHLSAQCEVRPAGHPGEHRAGGITWKADTLGTVDHMQKKQALDLVKKLEKCVHEVQADTPTVAEKADITDALNAVQSFVAVWGT